METQETIDGMIWLSNSDDILSWRVERGYLKGNMKNRERSLVLGDTLAILDLRLILVRLG